MTAKQPDEPHAPSQVTEYPQLQTEATRLPEPVTAPVDGTAANSDAALAHNMPATAFKWREWSCDEAARTVDTKSVEGAWSIVRRRGA